MQSVTFRMDNEEHHRTTGQSVEEALQTPCSLGHADWTPNFMQSVTCRLDTKQYHRTTGQLRKGCKLHAVYDMQAGPKRISQDHRSVS
ncbi:hypothetical protein PoB_001301100 [Plakobranchus ocellatus]|uniref:Uncharacterized protein n=1 Tax=Plakobranchus ocellatus TaxID=259542 RepID=A0AAV3YSY4_9GAST|nr:hypothetical protein PoB_001301100 [Plakobranchus ocellatus]